MVKLLEKCIEFHANWNLSPLYHCPQDLLCERQFLRAQRAEMALKGVNLTKNEREALIFKWNCKKIGIEALWTIIHMTYYWTIAKRSLFALRAKRVVQVK